MENAFCGQMKRLVYASNYYFNFERNVVRQAALRMSVQWLRFLSMLLRNHILHIIEHWQVIFLDA